MSSIFLLKYFSIIKRLNNDISSRVRRDFFWSWKKSFKTNDSDRYKDDDTRDDNTHTNEKSKRFKNEQSIIDKKKEYSITVIIAFFENSNDDRIRDFNELHLFIFRLCVCYHTARVCRKETYVYVYLRSRFLIKDVQNWILTRRFCRFEKFGNFWKILQTLSKTSFSLNLIFDLRNRRIDFVDLKIHRLLTKQSNSTFKCGLVVEYK